MRGRQNGRGWGAAERPTVGLGLLAAGTCRQAGRQGRSESFSGEWSSDCAKGQCGRKELVKTSHLGKGPLGMGYRRLEENGIEGWVQVRELEHRQEGR